MITGEQVRDAMIDGNILRVEHHTCTFCRYPCAYLRAGEQLFFDPGCDCGIRGEPEPRTWQEGADFINRQLDDAQRRTIAAAFGLVLP